MRVRIVEAVAFGVTAAAYYTLGAPPVLFWTVDWLATSFSLSLGPALAALWVAAEAVFFLLPFVAIRLWVAHSKRAGLPAALGALSGFWLPALLPAFGALAFGVSAPSFGGIGGTVATWLALAVDLAASAVGLGLVISVRRREETPLHPVAAH